MPTPITLPPPATPNEPLRIPHARDIISILTALPFFPDPDQAWAEAYWSESADQDPKNREFRSQVRAAVSASLEGMTATSGHWSGARAENERNSGYNIDRQLIASGLVRRLTARLPVGPDPDEWLEDQKAQNMDGAGRMRTHRACKAYLHARGRAEFKIGQGLLDAAGALLPTGLLAEAELLYGDGRNRAERLLIRDVLFACEDITIEEMASILVNTPYKLDEKRGDISPLWSADRIATDRTPLLFVHCRGIEGLRRGAREVVLEAVDFQSIDNLERCLSIMRDREQGMLGELHDLLADIRDNPPIYRGWRKRR